MDVYFSPYSLTPVKTANRLSSAGKKEGAILMTSISGIRVFADYFPHIELGDKPVEQFLQEFRNQDSAYERKLLTLLQKDLLYQVPKGLRINNHQLWSVGEKVKSKVAKYKIQHHEDYGFLELLKQNVRTRLDSNGLFTRLEFDEFYSKIPDPTNIEYMEDPLSTTNWNMMPLKTAQDFIKGTPADFTIYKPNREAYPEVPTPVIFSNYLGGNLGRWHAYSELVERGDLSLTHGVHTKGHYQEEKTFLFGNYFEGFSPDYQKVKEIYQDLHKQTWKILCSI